MVELHLYCPIRFHCVVFHELVTSSDNFSEICHIVFVLGSKPLLIFLRSVISDFLYFCFGAAPSVCKC
jgi:hypothetical protein